MNHLIENFLYYSAAVLGLLICIAPFIYAPFAKTWTRALVVQFVVGFSWAIVRLLSIIFFNEESPPGVFFVIVPLESLVYASVLRGLKLLLFELSPLKVLEEKVRFRVAAINSRWKNHSK